jgi:hypothetical protein
MAIPPIGVFLPTLAERGGPLADVVGAATHAEALGFESAWVIDQLVAGPGNAILESTLVVAAAATATTHPARTRCAHRAAARTGVDREGRGDAAAPVR